MELKIERTKTDFENKITTAPGTGIAELKLANSQIGVVEIQSLVALLQSNILLNRLNLNDNEIGDAGIKEVAEVLTMNTTLIELFIDNNQIGIDGAKDLAAALKINTTLTELNLWNNLIGDEGAQYLIEALEKNTTLTKLIFGANQVSPEKVRALEHHLERNQKISAIAEKALVLIKSFPLDDDKVLFAAYKQTHTQKEQALHEIKAYHPLANQLKQIEETWIEKQLDIIIKNPDQIKPKQALALFNQLSKEQKTSDDNQQRLESIVLNYFGEMATPGYSYKELMCYLMQLKKNQDVQLLIDQCLFCCFNDESQGTVGLEPSRILDALAQSPHLLRRLLREIPHLDKAVLSVVNRVLNSPQPAKEQNTKAVDVLLILQNNKAHNCLESDTLLLQGLTYIFHLQHQNPADFRDLRNSLSSAPENVADELQAKEKLVQHYHALSSTKNLQPKQVGLFQHRQKNSPESGSGPTKQPRSL